MHSKIEIVNQSLGEVRFRITLSGPEGEESCLLFKVSTFLEDPRVFIEVNKQFPVGIPLFTSKNEALDELAECFTQAAKVVKGLKSRE